MVVLKEATFGFETLGSAAAGFCKLTDRTVQREQRQKSNSLYFCMVGLLTVRYSEKNRSPVLFGSRSAYGKGALMPTAAAMLLMYQSSLWLK